MKSLLLVRHAKTEERSATGRDFDRALVKRGRDNAQQLAFELLAQNYQPDICLSSSAKRARETTEIVCSALQVPDYSLVYRDDLYLADESVLLSHITALDARVHHLMLVAHNPGISGLAHYIQRSLISPLPTCGAVLVRIAIDHWTDLSENCGIVERSIMPH